MESIISLVSLFLFYFQTIHCTEQWIVIDRPLTYYEGRYQCSLLNSTLATITSQDEATRAYQLCKQYDLNGYDTSYGNCWIGLYRNDNDEWQWESGSSSNYQYWGPNEPTGGNSDCTNIWPRYGAKWNSNLCDTLRPVLCDYNGITFSPSESPTSEPTREPSTTPTESPTMNQWIVIDRAMTYDEGRAECAALNTTMGTITNQDEAIRAYELCKEYDTNNYDTSYGNCWFGLRRDDNDEWQWESGATSDYQYWGPNEPTGGNSDCVNIWPRYGGKWNSNLCDTLRPVLCDLIPGKVTFNPTQEPTNEPTIEPTTFPPSTSFPTESPIDSEESDDEQDNSSSASELLIRNYYGVCIISLLIPTSLNLL